MESEISRQIGVLERRVANLEAFQTALPSPWENNRACSVEESETYLQDGVTLAGTVALHGHPSIQGQSGLPTCALLQQSWENAAQVFAALGHPTRLRLLRAVLSGMTRTAQLAQLKDLGSAGPLYHHLRELVAAGWLKSAGRGLHHVPTERVIPLLTMLVASEALGPAEEVTCEPV